MKGHVFGSMKNPSFLSYRWMACAGLLLLFSCNDVQPIEERRSKNNSYVGPSIDYKGRFRKGHARKKVSTHPNAVKRQNQARYYRKTHAKRK